MEDNKIEIVGTISVGITHVSGKLLFKNHNKKHARAYFSICHYSQTVFALFPEDYLNPTMVTTIKVQPELGYCDRASYCLDFKCKMNRFTKEAYINQFKDMGGFTLGLPQNFGAKDIWFNDPNLKWRYMWGKYALRPEGGTLRYDESKG